MAATSYKQRRTPGVYVTELNAFPPSVVGVQTAVPAFIGYTETAAISGKPVYNKPIKITSLADYEAIFGAGFKPTYTITEASADEVTAGNFDFKVFDPSEGANTWKYFNLAADTASQFNLYNSLRLFYANGGGNAYVVSVGPYQVGSTITPITKDDLERGLSVIKEQVGPTMLVIPDAVLLPSSGGEDRPWLSSDFADITKLMLRQAGELKDRVALLDVYGSQYTTKTNLDSQDGVISTFREAVGSEFLSYGMGYFPFLDTSVVPVSDFDYDNISNKAGAGNSLQTVLSWEDANLYNGGIIAEPGEGSARYQAVLADITKMTETAADTPAGIAVSQNLSAALPLYGDILRVMVYKTDKLPPSGAMAGIFTLVDSTRGVWNAPANIALTSVDAPTFKLTNEQQGDLNVPVDGKAVDAIREFVGRGTIVWGARTLDGNSNDFRYIQVRRTLIYIEQSIQAALQPFVFAPNDGTTWTTVISMCSNFLQGLWSQGGLMGATASEAFSVQCGLNSTMTGQDVLEGYMIVQITLQMIRPAEFIELTFKQKMEGVA